MRILPILICVLITLCGISQDIGSQAFRSLLKGDKGSCFKTLDSILAASIPTSIEHIRALEMKGECYYRLSDIGEAKRLWDKAADFRTRSFEQDHPAMTVAEVYRARYHSFMAASHSGHVQAAKEASAVAKRTLLNSDHPLISEREKVMALNTYAYASKLIHPDSSWSYSKAAAVGRSAYKDALDFADHIDNAFWTSQILHGIGNTYTDEIGAAKGSNRFRVVVDSARWYYCRSLEILENIGMEYSTPTMMEHFTLALVSKNAFGVDSIETTAYEFNSAMDVLHGMTGKREFSTTDFDPAIADKAQMVELIDILSDSYTIAYEEKNEAAYLDTAIATIEASFPYYEAMLEEYSETEFHKVTGIYSHFPFSLAAELYALRYFLTKAPEDLDRSFYCAERNKNILEQRDGQISFLNSYAQVDTFSRSKTVKNELVVSYHYHRNTFAYWVDQTGSGVIDLDLPAALQNKIRSGFTEYVSSFSNDFDIEQSKILCQELLTPVLNGRNIDQLTIIPVEGMWHLPFSSLMKDGAESPKVVIQDLSIRYSRVIQEALNDPIKTHDRSFHLTRPSKTAKSELPFNDALILELEEDRPNTTTIDLNRSDLTDALKTDGILHIATHAEYPDEVDAMPYLYLNDGVLTQEVLATMECNKDLVIIAACSSGKGPIYKNQGSLDLGHALLRAGAKCVVQTLWPVDDKATAEVLSHMYDGLADGQPVSLALANAQRQFIEVHKNDAYSSPYYWAGLVVVGNDVVFETSNRIWLWLAGGIVLLLVFYFSLSNRRRARSAT